MLRGGWDSGQEPGPAPSGKRRFWLRFGPFGATSVVPPRRPPGGAFGLSRRPPRSHPASPPGRPAAASPAASGLLPGRPGLPPRPARISSSAGISSRLYSFPDFELLPGIPATRIILDARAIHLPWPLQIHHILEGHEWHNLTPGLDCSHRQAIHNRKAWC